MLTFRKYYFICALVLLMVEIYIALYMNDPFIRPYGGDFLVVIFLYCLLRSFLKAPALAIALGVLILSYLVEFSQFYHLIFRLGMENSLLAHLILGSTFKWLDLVAYTLGIATVLMIEQFTFRNGFKPIPAE